MSHRQTLGEHLRQERKLKGWTLKELSVRCDLSVPFLSELETNKTDITFKCLLKILNAHHETISEFFEFFEPDYGDIQRVCFNFDGMIHSFTSEFDGDVTWIPNPPVAGVFEMLEEYVRHFDMYIYSFRAKSDKGVEAMRNYVNKEFVKWSKHASITPITYHLNFVDYIPPDALFIDRNSFRFSGSFPTSEELKNLLPSNLGKLPSKKQCDE